MAVNAEKQAAIVNAILRQQNDTAVRETRQLLVSPLTRLPSLASSNTTTKALKTRRPFDARRRRPSSNRRTTR